MHLKLYVNAKFRLICIGFAELGGTESKQKFHNENVFLQRDLNRNQFYTCICQVMIFVLCHATVRFLNIARH